MNNTQKQEIEEFTEMILINDVLFDPENPEEIDTTALLKELADYCIEKDIDLRDYSDKAFLKSL